MSRIYQILAVAVAYLSCAGLQPGWATTDADIRTAIEPTNRVARVAAIERLLSDPEAADRVLAYADRADLATQSKLAVLAGATLGAAEIAGLLVTRPAFAPAGSVAREVLAAAFLEKIRAVTAAGKRSKKQVPTKLIAPETSLGSATRAAITALADDPNWRVRRVAAALLADISFGHLTDTHNQLLHDAEWPVRLAAIYSLALLPGSTVQQTLEQIMEASPGEEEKRAALQALGMRGCLDVVLRALRTQTGRLQFDAVFILGNQPMLTPTAIATVRSVGASTRNKYLRREIRKLLEQRTQ